MSDWYARRLAGQQHPSQPPVVPPRREPTAQPQPQPQAHYQRPTPSSLQTDRCPSCASANFMAPVGTNQKRCFDCGYPVVQSGTGVGAVGAQTDGKVHRATQVASGGYHPTQIVGRVD